MEKSRYVLKHMKTGELYVPYSKLIENTKGEKIVQNRITNSVIDIELTDERLKKCKEIVLQDDKTWERLTKSLELKDIPLKDGDMYENFGYIFTAEIYKVSDELIKEYDLLYKTRCREYNPLYNAKYGPISEAASWISEVKGNDNSFIKTAAKDNLPKGWYWEDFNDGSGGLRMPNGKTFVGYDLQTGEYWFTVYNGAKGSQRSDFYFDNWNLKEIKDEVSRKLEWAIDKYLPEDMKKEILPGNEEVHIEDTSANFYAAAVEEAMEAAAMEPPDMGMEI